MIPYNLITFDKMFKFIMIIFVAVVYSRGCYIMMVCATVWYCIEQHALSWKKNISYKNGHGPKIFLVPLDSGKIMCPPKNTCPPPWCKLWTLPKGLFRKLISWHIWNIEKQWIKHRSLPNLRHGPMLYPLFFNVPNMLAVIVIQGWTTPKIIF